MLPRRGTSARSALVVLITCGIFAMGPEAAAQHLKGKLKHDVYTSPEKDFQIPVARGFPFGESVADGVTTKGLLSSWMYAADNSGTEYMIESFPAQELELDEALLLFPGVHDKKILQTSRGREWRVVSDPRPPLSLTLEAAPGGPSVNLIVVSALFASHGRIYKVGAEADSEKSQEERIASGGRIVDGVLSRLQILDAGTPERSPDVDVKTSIQGTFSNDVYTDPTGDFRVRAPRMVRGTLQVKDEGGPSVGWQVLFLDRLGGFYRVVRVDLTGKTVEDALRTLHEPREKQEIQTARGRELHVIDVERANAEVRLSIVSGGETKQETPDLVTANAIFMANDHVHHVVAGVVSFDPSNIQGATEVARQRLEKFLAGFEALAKKR
ncbi:MAG: hypothetical protein WCA49_20825 [Candidatus Sulfotelmatobacter sp.]